jgi:hypothetical protein
VLGRGVSSSIIVSSVCVPSVGPRVPLRCHAAGLDAFIRRAQRMARRGSSGTATDARTPSGS